jgi:large subunit ribosomal protein L35
MPKIKTRKSMAKRIKVTGTGKILRGHAFQNHKKAAKSKRSLRKMDDMVTASPGLRRQIRKLVPGLKVRKQR